MSTNNGLGPGYASPLDAIKKGPREEILYVVAVQPDPNKTTGDVLATVDVNPNSPTYCKIIHRLRTGAPNNELHHSGWNICSSCHGSSQCCKRDKLVLPSLVSNRIFIVDTGKTPRAPSFHKIIEPEEVNVTNCTALHTSHCLASGEIMISAMGDLEGNGKSDYVLLDGKTFNVKGTWVKGKAAKYNYDFWYQPYHDVMVSTEWGPPKSWKKGFSSSMILLISYRFYKKPDGTWTADNVIQVPPKKVSGWTSNYIGGLISDILISLDDRFLYFNNWLHGDVRQYDITDRAHPKLVDQIFLGGKILSDSDLNVLEDPELSTQPEPVYIKGKRFFGGPQMLQLSLDGKRLYISTSLYSAWDKHFYPETMKEGGRIVKIDIDIENGGMTLDTNFVVDFSEGDDGPLLPHEMRYPGGDCTSDIWLATE
ncbi:methanethiol oxidase-like [Rhynchophorus ferrugineus]|uniref:methanethiol oxidase-like n=1 Tax=Rhynchophorus ferrugineus TaxID=354439 RepID=UPI003FCCAC9B